MTHDADKEEGMNWLSDSMTPDKWPFHKHLDKCEQCREHPFNLCPIGAFLLITTCQAIVPKKVFCGAEGDKKP
jgi:hypothetical protein